MAALLAGAAFLFLTCPGCDRAGKVASETIKPPVAIEILTVGSGEWVEEIKANGNIESKFFADVKTQVSGLVRQVYVTEWVRVKKGDKLARIEVRESEAVVKRCEAAIEAAKAVGAEAGVAATRAERELERLVKLKEYGLATQQSLDDAGSEASAAVSRTSAARAQIVVAQEELAQARAHLEKGLVTAPMEGVVAFRGVNVGDLASDGSEAPPIFRIVDNRLLNLTVSVPSIESARLRVGQLIEFTVDPFPNRVFTGTVTHLNPEFTAADRSLKVMAEIKNEPELLKGGLFAKGTLVVNHKETVIQLPRPALLDWNTAAFTAGVFVVEGDRARLRRVATGTADGNRVEIVFGVKEGERIVVRGGFALKDGDAVTVVTAEQSAS